MIYKFELDNDNLLLLFRAFTFAEIYLQEFLKDSELQEKVTTLKKIIENSVWGKLNVKVEGEE